MGSLSEVWQEGSVSQGGKCLGAIFFGPQDPCSRLGLVVEKRGGEAGGPNPFSAWEGAAREVLAGSPRGCPLKLGTSPCCFL